MELRGDSRKIGDVNEGIVEAGEDAGNTENELACARKSSQLYVNLRYRIPGKTNRHRQGGRGRRSPWPWGQSWEALWMGLSWMEYGEKKEEKRSDWTKYVLW